MNLLRIEQILKPYKISLPIFLQELLRKRKAQKKRESR